MAKSDTLQIRIDEELKRKLQEMADRKGLAMSQLVRMIIIEYAENEKRASE